MRSLECFDHQNLIDPVLIIVDKHDPIKIDRLLRSAGRKTLILKHEDEIEPLLNRLQGVNGWKKQQVLKLAASGFVPTPLYLTFDADIVCAKTPTYGDLVCEGRGLVQSDGKFGCSSASNRSSWWSASAGVLRTSPRFCEPGVAVVTIRFCSQPKLAAS